MSISESDVTYIARLARLGLTPEETKSLAHDLGAILEYVERIAELESGVGATARLADPAPGPTPFREDVVLPSLPVDEALRPSADHDDAFFRVPPVIDREDGS